MFRNEKCTVGLKKDGGWVIPHDPDGWTESVQYDEPVVALEKYAEFDDTILPVCAWHRHLVQELYTDYKAWEAAGKPPRTPLNYIVSRAYILFFFS